MVLLLRQMLVDFDDPNGIGNGGIPIGIVISEGELKYGSRNQNIML